MSNNNNSKMPAEVKARWTSLSKTVRYDLVVNLIKTIGVGKAAGILLTKVEQTNRTELDKKVYEQYILLLKEKVAGVQTDHVAVLMRAIGVGVAADILLENSGNTELTEFTNKVNAKALALMEKRVLEGAATTKAAGSAAPAFVSPTKATKRTLDDFFFDQSDEEEETTDELDPEKLEKYFDKKFGITTISNKQVNIILGRTLILGNVNVSPKKTIHENAETFIETIIAHYGIVHNFMDMKRNIPDLDEVSLVKPTLVLEYLTKLGLEFVQVAEKDFQHILKCKDKRSDPFLLVFRPEVHELNEKITEKNCPTKWPQFSLLFQEKNLLVPFNTEQRSMMLGTQLREERYDVTWDAYCFQNFNNKFCPVTSRFKQGKRKMKLCTVFAISKKKP
ncbi:hypothetical protein FRACYDRAFT_237005 [Fragilariopsis cylindrus CCMP1102]|uniref:Uncharacterized protein n=1 Tax=Fragilariopsis cylindrus CCMP1102 TaxID=635003 RepID=A0A1E7FKP8_9STRA|nr:hypothetical protein FRACYDRAFT_237005 [Fragilariopsis cylindrus CCMP1102]|eukprot:OEU18726.1 hypothetical protein FRACYDRAFT_237005 [Fragilariopsis cylindrus CCMP1102]